MNKLHDAVRMALATSLSDRAIAAALGMSKTTVRRYRSIAAVKQLSWADLCALTPQALEAQFNAAAGRLTTKRVPDFATLHTEIETKGVTLQLLWEEYRAPSPDDALSYSQFTHHYRAWAHCMHPVMRQHHRPGEKAFVDYSGKRPVWRDRTTGRDIPAELFVGALGVSSYVFAICTASQSIPDWIHASVKMLEFYGGVPEIIVPDNLKSAVEKPGRSPKIQRTYLDFARHYAVAIIPARVYRPQDKAKAEQSVQMAQRWILACMRHETFFSLADLNTRIAELLKALNRRPYKRLPGCRRSRFEELDQPALHPLPTVSYEFAEWVARQKVPNDYHVNVRGHFYSVPHVLIDRRVEVRITRSTVEIFCDQVRVATHVLSDVRGGYSTLPEHQPEAHRAQAGRTPERQLAWAATVGPNTTAVMRSLFDRRLPALGLPAADKMRRLATQYGVEELEAAARRAVEIKSLTVTTLTALLRTGLHRRRTDSTSSPRSLPLHDNVRGPAYYSKGD
jgi:transposase